MISQRQKSLLALNFEGIYILSHQVCFIKGCWKDGEGSASTAGSIGTTVRRMVDMRIT